MASLKRTVYHWILEPYYDTQVPNASLEKLFQFLELRFNTARGKNKLIPCRGKDTIDAFFGVKVKDGYITGKIVRARKDLWPEVFDAINATLSSIQIPKGSELAESTHFAIKKINSNKYALLLEYNHYGAKINDFQELLRIVGQNKNCKMLLDSLIIPKFNKMNDLVNDFEDIREFIFAVPNKNIQNLKNKDLILALDGASKPINDVDIIEVKWVLEDGSSAVQKVKNVLKDLVSTRADQLKYIENLKTKCRINNGNLKWFDILKSRTSYDIRPKKISKKVADSSDFYKLLIEKL